MTNVVQTIRKGTSERQLVCFPFLGGYANSYADLAAALAGDIEVVAINPPGHGPCRKTPLRSAAAMADFYSCELTARLKKRCILFGHSMGAIVAFLVTNRLMASPDCAIKPSGLIISASNSPGFFERHRMTSKSDDDILKYLLSTGGIPEELRGETALLKHFAPAYKADFAALESVATAQLLPVHIPAFQCFGTRDGSVTRESSRKWHRYFPNGLREFEIDGGHMYVTQNASQVARHIEQIFIDVDAR